MAGRLGLDPTEESASIQVTCIHFPCMSAHCIPFFIRSAKSVRRPSIEPRARRDRGIFCEASSRRKRLEMASASVAYSQ
jgi:hypothetical protein